MATRQNRICEKYFSAAYELKAAGTNFFRQSIDRNEFWWGFPHPCFLSDVLGHLDEQNGRGAVLLICIPSLLAFSSVFAAGKTARFVKA